jgi:hypothetical protein
LRYLAYYCMLLRAKKLIEDKKKEKAEKEKEVGCFI